MHHSRPASTVDGAVGQQNVPALVLERSSLAEIDYVDHFTMSTDVDATAEQWARAIFGDVPGAAERLIWSGLLHLRLSRGRSPDTIAGWSIATREPDWIRLEAASWFLTGNLIVGVIDRRVSLTTCLRYDRRYGRLLWPPLSAVHRRLSPGLLPDAEKKIRRSRGRAGAT